MTAQQAVNADLPLALRIEGLGKTFPGQQALAGVDLKVRPGEVHGLLGANGSGKSTLVKILSGYHRPDPGSVVEIAGQPLHFASPAVSHRLGARFVHQDLGLVGSSSVADNLFLGDRFPTRIGTILNAPYRRAARELLSVAGIDLDPDMVVSELTPAQRTGVAVARALRPTPGSETHLLVLDEPTAALPEHEVEQLLAIVRAVSARGVGVVYVTHRIDEIFEIGDRITVLRDGRKVADREVRGLDHDQLTSLLVGEGLARRVAAPAARVPGDVVLRARGLTSGQIRAVDLEVRVGEVTGIAGITGSGRDVLLGAVFGAGDRTAGEVRIGAARVRPGDVRAAVRAGAGFVPADRKAHAAVIGMSARENLTLPDLKSFRRAMTLVHSREATSTRTWFEHFKVRPKDGVEMPLAQFSGGNQQKIVIAKWLRRRSSLLLIDEPTQGVDLGAKAEIHRRLALAAEEGAGVVVSSSDDQELADLCDRVLVMRRGRIVADLCGSQVTAEQISRLSIHDSRE